MITWSTRRATYELFTESQLMDLKPSTLIEVTNNEATIDLEMQQSNDLQTWSKVGESISIPFLLIRN